MKFFTMWHTASITETMLACAKFNLLLVRTHFMKEGRLPAELFHFKFLKRKALPSYLINAFLFPKRKERQSHKFVAKNMENDQS